MKKLNGIYRFIFCCAVALLFVAPLNAQGKQDRTRKAPPREKRNPEAPDRDFVFSAMRFRRQSRERRTIFGGRCHRKPANIGQ